MIDNFNDYLHDFVKNSTHEYFTTQTKICSFIVERIYNRVIDGHGPKFGGIKIDIKHNLIIEGNHRYIAYKLAGFEFEKIPWSKNFSDNSSNINDFIIVTDEDWDANCEQGKKYLNDDFLDELE